MIFEVIRVTLQILFTTCVSQRGTLTEDHNHLLKCVCTRLREGTIPGLDLRHLRDALHDPATGVTYEALTGKYKQSVPDCERLIGRGVIDYLRRKGHESDVKVIKRSHNWRKAVDGRGLSEEQRSSYCPEVKEWILSDWMPWFTYMLDHCTIDVTRYVHFNIVVHAC